MSENMAKMKNHDCPLGVSYVAIKAEKSKRKVDWVSMACLVVDLIMVSMGLILAGAALAAWVLIR